jgi:uncharacterized integral membrane protein
MKRILRLISIPPLLLLLALFAGSNRQAATLKLWPTDFSLELPLALAVLGTAGLAFLCGGLLVWFGTFRLHRQLRRSEEAVRLLEDRIRALGAQNQALPPPTV